MKAITLINYLLLLLFLLLPDRTYAKEVTYQYIYESKVWDKLEESRDLGGIVWDFKCVVKNPSEGLYTTYFEKEGHSFGKNANPVNWMTFTSGEIKGNIRKITVNTGHNSGDTKVHCSIDGISYAQYPLGYSKDICLFEGSASGKITLRWDQSGSDIKAIRIKSVTIIYEPLIVPVPELSTVNRHVLPGTVVEVIPPLPGAFVSCSTDGGNTFSTPSTEPYRLTVDTDTELIARTLFDTQQSKNLVHSYTVIPRTGYIPVLRESFDGHPNQGGNDNIWDAGYGPLDPASYPGWELGEGCHTGYHCLHIDNSQGKGYVVSPPLGVTGELMMAFRAGFKKGENGLTLRISLDPGETPDTLVAIDANRMDPYFVRLQGVTPDTRIRISAATPTDYYFDSWMLLQRYADEPVADLVLTGLWENEVINKVLITHPELTALDLSLLKTNEIENIQLPETSNCVVYSRDNHGLNRNAVVYDRCEQLRLTDSKSFNTLSAFNANTLYSRLAWQDGEWETLMLPFDVASGQMPAEYLFDEFSGISDDGTAVVFTQVAELKANTPYLMKYIGSETGVVQKECLFAAEDVTVNSTIRSAGFVGVYTRTPAAGKHILGMKNGQAIFGIGSENAYVEPFRAYLDLQTGPGGVQPMKVIHQPGNASDLSPTGENRWLVWQEHTDLVIRNQQKGTFRLISPNGECLRTWILAPGEHRLPAPEKGLYLINRKKILIR